MSCASRRLSWRPSRARMAQSARFSLTIRAGSLHHDKTRRSPTAGSWPALSSVRVVAGRRWLDEMVPPAAAVRRWDFSACVPPQSLGMRQSQNSESQSAWVWLKCAIAAGMAARHVV